MPPITPQYTLVATINGISFPLVYITPREMYHMQARHGYRVGFPHFWTQDWGQYTFYPQTSENITLEVQPTAESLT